MSKIFLVFFCCGKSTFCRKNPNPWNEIDLAMFKAHKNPDILTMLIKFFSRDRNLLIGGGIKSLEVVKKFKDFEYNIILPVLEMKDEIIERAAVRDGPITSKYLTKVYDEEWEALDKAPFNTKVYLKPGQYLSDIIDENGEYKPGIDVIYGK